MIAVVFWPMQNVFYQQDEWRALGSYFSNESFLENFKNFNLQKIILADGRFFSAIIGYFLMAQFPFNTTPLFIYSLVFHIINIFLVFTLSRQIIRSYFPSLLAALFFGLSSVSVGAVTWYSTSIGTLPATTLVLISIIFLQQGLEKNKNKYFILTFITLYVSQYFKEIGYFYLLGFPLISYIYKKFTITEFIKTFWYYFLAFGSIAVFRYVQLASYTAHTAVFTSQNSNNFLITVLTRAILYPLTSFSLIYIQPDYLLFIAKKFARIYYPFFPGPQFDLLVQSVVGDLIAISASLIIFFILHFFSKTKEYRKKIIFLVLVTLISYLPYIILSKDYTYLDSRYYYLGAAPAGIILATILNQLRSRFSKIYLISLNLFILYLIFNAFQTNIQIKNLSNASLERLSVLNQLTKLSPILTDRNIFYITGDKNFYLTVGNNLPFQQGTGYTLLTWYGKDDNKFNKSLNAGLLWDLGSQGYFEEERRGFGYFWDKKELLKTIRERKIPESNVKSFYYDSVNQRLNEITLSP